MSGLEFLWEFKQFTQLSESLSLRRSLYSHPAPTPHSHSRSPFWHARLCPCLAPLVAAAVSRPSRTVLRPIDASTRPSTAPSPPSFTTFAPCHAPSPPLDHHATLSLPVALFRAPRAAVQPARTRTLSRCPRAVLPARSSRADVTRPHASSLVRGHAPSRRRHAPSRLARSLPLRAPTPAFEPPSPTAVSCCRKALAPPSHPLAPHHSAFTPAPAYASHDLKFPKNRPRAPSLVVPRPRARHFAPSRRHEPSPAIYTIACAHPRPRRPAVARPLARRHAPHQRRCFTCPSDGPSCPSDAAQRRHHIPSRCPSRALALPPAPAPPSCPSGLCAPSCAAVLSFRGRRFLAAVARPRAAILCSSDGISTLWRPTDIVPRRHDGTLRPLALYRRRSPPLPCLHAPPPALQSRAPVLPWCRSTPAALSHAFACRRSPPLCYQVPPSCLARRHLLSVFLHAMWRCRHAPSRCPHAPVPPSQSPCPRPIDTTARCRLARTSARGVTPPVPSGPLARALVPAPPPPLRVHSASACRRGPRSPQHHPHIAAPPRHGCFAPARGCFAPASARWPLACSVALSCPHITLTSPH
ncbi:hypothetical protein DENSPDRAFT_886471 [Dentipellis sp. KUC8613]|nr:hypothetical protein DENSPDRAFT_886471 [Dentipellis sp. KUC8613]